MTVQTVLGPVDADELGRVLPHEHVLSLVPGPWLSDRDAGDPAELAEEQVERAVGALSGLRELGFGCVVDLSPYGVVGRADQGENIELLARVSRESGVHIVAGTSTYLPAFSPAWVEDADLATLTRRFVADLDQGIGGTGIRAGVLGEQATGLGIITEQEERCLRAAIRASVETGASLITHTTHATMADEQLAVVRDEGGDPTRIAIGHMDIADELDPLVRLLDQGVSLAFDTIGKQFWDFFLEPPSPDPAEGEYAKRAFHRSDRTRAERLVALVERGYSAQLLLSQDLTGAEVSLNPSTHGAWGYRYLDRVFLPLCRSLGLGGDAVDQLTRLNPARLLEVAA